MEIKPWQLFIIHLLAVLSGLLVELMLHWLHML